MQIDKIYIRLIISFMILLVVGYLVYEQLAINSNGVGPSWRGLTIGLSTTRDVYVTLESPSQIRQKDNSIILTYETEQHRTAYELTLRNNVLVQIQDNVVNAGQQQLLTAYINKFGSPDNILWVRESRLYCSALYINQGVLVTSTAGRLNESRVTVVNYFQPCSLLCVLNMFGDRVSLLYPFVRSDVVSSKDPWSCM